MKYPEDFINKIIPGDCVKIMKIIPDESIDFAITSPPYDNLRTFKGYDFNFEVIAKELYRILKSGGVLVWIVGDATIKGSETGTSFRQALYFKDVCGFNLHDTMIYEKAGEPYPGVNRYTNVFEYMFVLSKGKPKTINLIKDKKNKWAGQSTFGSTSNRNKDGSIRVEGKRIINEYGIRTNIWRYANGYGYGQTDDIAYKHPATFPEKLAKDHILTWTNDGDIVIDPMCGSGTACKMALLNKRKYIGIDVAQEYVELATKRLELCKT